MNPVENFDLIIPLLEFHDKNDFYIVNILKRKKDQDVPSNHQSARTIKVYYIKSTEELLSKKDEIISLCEVFNARAGINLNRFNHKDFAFTFLKETIERIEQGHYDMTGLALSCAWKSKSKSQRWLIDCDSQEEYETAKKALMDPELRPHGVNKIIAEIPTRKGWHLITSSFDTSWFRDAKAIRSDMFKSNPTALYYPSLKEES